MAALGYAGPFQTTAAEVANEGYVATLLATNMSQAAVDALITSGFAGYASKAYVDTQDALNATKAYIDAGDATRLHISQIGANNGIAGLNSGGRIDFARINLASTQRWPKPFISPTAYNAAPLSGTTEQQLYTCPVADPGFVYKLLVFGEVDASVSLDDGEYPISFVRTGSISGPIVAYGAGLPESYQVPAPGTPSSRATLGTPFTAPSSYTIVGGWSPQNGGGSIYTTTMSGNYMQALATETATITASLTYAGAVVASKSTVSTQIEIVNNSGTVIGTAGTAVDGLAGTCTVSFTGSVTSGQLYGIKMAQSGASTFATVSSGFLAISGPQVTNTAPIPILPANVDTQAPITGASTLYVTLWNGGGAASVTATAVRPGLWVVPVPA